MVFDTHAHVLPELIPDAPEGVEDWPRMEPATEDDARLLVAGALRFTARDVFYRAERRLSAMDSNGVTAELVSPMPPMLNYRLPALAMRDLGRAVNEFIAGLRKTDPNRFFGLGMVPLQDPELAAAELAHVGELGLQGIEIGSNIAGAALGDPRFLDFFAEAERLSVPIFVHAMSPALGDRLPPSAIGTFGFATEVSLAAASIITSGTAEKFPGLRLSFSHGAGGFPLMLTRAQYFWSGAWNEESPVKDTAGQSPTDIARRFYYDALVFDRRALRYLIDMLGADRLLLGTDFPAMPREDPADHTLASMDLPADTHRDLTWDNGFRFLGIDPPPS